MAALSSSDSLKTARHRACATSQWPEGAMASESDAEEEEDAAAGGGDVPLLPPGEDGVWAALTEILSAIALAVRNSFIRLLLLRLRCAVSSSSLLNVGCPAGRRRRLRPQSRRLPHRARRCRRSP